MKGNNNPSKIPSIKKKIKNAALANAKKETYINPMKNKKRTTKIIYSKNY